MAPRTSLQGKELSYTNLLDLDAAARIVLEFDEPAAAVIKHTNPCGVATGAPAAEAYVRARDADALSAFGGIVGLNRPLDVETRGRITVDLHRGRGRAGGRRRGPAAAGGEAEPARGGRWTPRLPPAGARAARAELRSVLGGLLVQDRDVVSEAHEPWPHDGVRVVTRAAADGGGVAGAALRLAGLRAREVEHRALRRGRQTLAIGAGQMSRVDAVKVAVVKASGWATPAAPLAGTVAASDAFFPFRDGLDAVAAAGATAVVQPGGSMRDAEVIAAADEHGLAMVFTGRRHFRH